MGPYLLEDRSTLKSSLRAWAGCKILPCSTAIMGQTTKILVIQSENLIFIQISAFTLGHFCTLPSRKIFSYFLTHNSQENSPFMRSGSEGLGYGVGSILTTNLPISLDQAVYGFVWKSLRAEPRARIFWFKNLPILKETFFWLVILVSCKELSSYQLFHLWKNWGFHDCPKM